MNPSARSAITPKSPEAFRTISEVASDLQIAQHVLRFWETRFAQIRPMKRGGGRRYYRSEEVALLRGIRSLLYEHGYTIRGVQKILRERGIQHVVAIGSCEPASIRLENTAGSLPIEEPYSEREIVEETGIPQPALSQRVKGAADEDRRVRLKSLLQGLLLLKSQLRVARNHCDVLRSGTNRFRSDCGNVEGALSAKS